MPRKQARGALWVATCIAAAACLPLLVDGATCPAGQYGLSNTCLSCPLNTYKSGASTVDRAAAVQSGYKDDGTGYAGYTSGLLFDGSIGSYGNLNSNFASGLSVSTNNFFNSDSDFWGYWVLVDMGSTKQITQVELTSAALAFMNRTPRSFRIYATNDASSYTTPNTKSGQWVQLGSWTDIDQWGGSAAKTFPLLEAATSYRYYGFITNKVQDGSFFALEQLSFYTDTCVSCPAGKYTSSTGNSQSSSCQACAAGQYSKQGYSCQYCLPGQASLSGSSKCTLCPVNTYAQSSGSASCSQCPGDTITAEQGSATCGSPCSTGSHSNNGLEVCQKCNAGKFLPLTQSLSSTKYPRQPSGASNTWTYDGITVSAKASSVFDAAYDVNKLFDLTLSDIGFISSGGYLSDGSTSASTFIGTDSSFKGVYFALDLGQAIVLDKYAIFPPNDLARSPRNWRLYGSTSSAAYTAPANDATWVLLDARSGSVQADWVLGQGREFSVAHNKNPYRYYALTINAIVGSSSYLSLEGWFLYTSPCTVCPAGSAAISGSATCALCSQASFQISSGSPKCIPCSSGNAGTENVTGSTSPHTCSLCAAGRGSYSSVLCEPTLMGNPIQGVTDASIAEARTATALSANGERLVVGWHTHGSSRGKIAVYEYVSGQWVEMAGASDFVGANVADQLGFSVAISHDGTRIAAGASGYDKTASYLTAGAGMAWEYSAGSWVRLGGLMQWSQSSNGEMGTSIAMSADGLRVAFGAPGGTAVEIWDYDAGSASWISVPRVSNANGNFGFSISMSYDGLTLVVGNGRYNSYEGEARVYEYSQASKTWAEIASTPLRVGTTNVYGAWCVAISGDGKRVATGTPNIYNYAGVVKVWERSGTTTTWTRLGNDLPGDAYDNLGRGMAFSATGSRLAAAMYRRKESAYGSWEFGSIAVFEYSTTTSRWEILTKRNITGALTSWNGATIKNFGEIVSMTPDGTIIASGGNTNTRGDVYVHSLSPQTVASVQGAKVRLVEEGVYSATFSDASAAGRNYLTFKSSTVVDILMVGGGGGGSREHGGGGGAGALLYISSSTVPAGSYMITVGQGGDPGTGEAGSKGGNTVFASVLGSVTLTAEGGGAGGGTLTTGAGANRNGGCGGGGDGQYAGAVSTRSAGSAVSYSIPAGFTGVYYGFGGAAASGSGNPSSGGGGGGCGAAATYSSTGQGLVSRSVGGAGRCSATVSSTTYDFRARFGLPLDNSVGSAYSNQVCFCGGGGGGTFGNPEDNGDWAAGGLGGGGAGGKCGMSSTQGDPGLAGLNSSGSGGGGGGDWAVASLGGRGGSGVVIVRWQEQARVAEFVRPVCNTVGTYYRGGYATSCDQCPPGKFQVSAPASGCFSCSRGSPQLGVGSNASVAGSDTPATCSACAAGNKARGAPDTCQELQLGSRLQAAGSRGQLGASVAVSSSSEGLKVASGMPLYDTPLVDAGGVLVSLLNESTSTWTQVGSSVLIGTAAGDLAGTSTAMSDDGSLVAVGMPGYSSGSGAVKVWAWDGAFWKQRGSNLLLAPDPNAAAALAGSSVAMSGAGARVAVGMPGYLSGKGAVQVWEFSDASVSWGRLGPPLEGSEAGGKAGASVALSGDGAVVAVGMPGAGNQGGLAKVWAWQGAAWSQRGGALQLPGVGASAGRSVAISANGAVVAIGAPGYGQAGGVAAFAWQGGAWVQMGPTITGQGPEFGKMVSLSADGYRLLVGTASASQAALLWDWTGAAWEPTTSPVQAPIPCNSTALSLDGTRVVLGMPSFDGVSQAGARRLLQASGQADGAAQVSAVTQCPEGTGFSLLEGACVQLFPTPVGGVCEANHWLDGPANKCMPCAAQLRSPRNSTKASDCVCDSGKPPPHTSPLPFAFVLSCLPTHIAARICI